MNDSKEITKVKALSVLRETDEYKECTSIHERAALVFNFELRLTLFDFLKEFEQILKRRNDLDR